MSLPKKEPRRLAYACPQPHSSRFERLARWIAAEAWGVAWLLMTLIGTIAIALLVPATGWIVFVSIFAFLATMAVVHRWAGRLLRTPRANDQSAWRSDD